jgi:hypothetical protein
VEEPGAPGPAGCWREHCPAHPDVAAGRLGEADFAADLAQVRAGTAPPGYGEPAAFFARTHLTEGLRRLLTAAARRLRGGGGAPVVHLRAGFGGGKTHAMLALHHLCRSGEVRGLPGVGPLLDAAGLPGLPRVRQAALVGTDLGAARPWPCPELGGRPVRTLWGDLAAQLGGPEGYAAVAEEDASAAPPGAAALAALLLRAGPCAILCDELLAFLRVLAHRRAELPAGSLDANLTFVQNLTEAVRRSPAALLVATLPTAGPERGGRGGQWAAEALEATLGRVEAAWDPVLPAEGPAIVRRRLFGAPGPGVEAVCRAFAGLYGGRPEDFPADCRSAPYLERLRAAYPIHPEIFDRLRSAWMPLPRFQGLRGMLRFLAAAAAELGRRGDARPLILPGGLPLGAPRVAEQLLRAAPEGWDEVLRRDVDGEEAVAAALARTDARLDAAPRLARALFLASGPGAPPAEAGCDLGRLRLAVAVPGEPGARVDEGLAALRDRLAHLHTRGGRLLLDRQPNAAHRAWAAAAEVAEATAAADAATAVARWARRADAGALRGVVVDGASADGGSGPADDPVARLVVLSPAHPHDPGAGEDGPAVGRARAILLGERYGTNMLVFLAADAASSAGLLEAARLHLAWGGLPAAGGTGRDVSAGLRESGERLRRRIPAAYRWLLVPVQEPGRELRWEALRLGGDGDPLAEASRRLQAERLLLTECAPAELRLELDRLLWREAPHIAVTDLWSALTKYVYLPRLADADVLCRAIARGVAAGAFGYADGIDADGRYRNLRLGPPAPEVRIGPGPLLVRPEASPPAAAGPAAPEASAPATRFRGAVTVDPADLPSTATRIAREILRHLEDVPGARAEVRIQIDVRLPAGAPEDVARAVAENAAVLRLQGPGFAP